MFKVIKESNRMTPIDIKEIGMTQFILTSKLWKCATGTFTMTFSWKGMKRVPTVKLFWYNHSKKQFLLAQILFIFLTMLKVMFLSTQPTKWMKVSFQLTLNKYWHCTLWTQVLLDVFWTSYVRSIYIMCPGGKLLPEKLLITMNHQNFGTEASPNWTCKMKIAK